MSEPRLGSPEYPNDKSQRGNGEDGGHEVTCHDIREFLDRRPASLGLRYTLGHSITAAIPPGDEAYFRLAMDVAQNYKPLDSKEEQALLHQASGLEPIFHRGNDV